MDKFDKIIEIFRNWEVPIRLERGKSCVPLYNYTVVAKEICALFKDEPPGGKWFCTECARQLGGPSYPYQMAREVMVEYSNYVDKTMNRKQKRGPLVIPLGYDKWLDQQEKNADKS